VRERYTTTTGGLGRGDSSTGYSAVEVAEPSGMNEGEQVGDLGSIYKGEKGQ